MIINDRNITGLVSGTAYTLNQIGIFFNRTNRRALGMQFINMSRSVENAAGAIVKEQRNERIEQHRLSIIEEQEKQKERFVLKVDPESIGLDLSVEEFD